jgi:hypothetical protein
MGCVRSHPLDLTSVGADHTNLLDPNFAVQNLEVINVNKAAKHAQLETAVLVDNGPVETSDVQHMAYIPGTSYVVVVDRIEGAIWVSKCRICSSIRAL